MSPRTKGKVKYGRMIQLGLRVLALIGAAGSLFCAVVIKGAAVITWIIRVGVSSNLDQRGLADCFQPIVAILHTLYGIYHLSRPMTRPAGTQASYMIFAATFDLGLIPFYVFAAYIGQGQYTAGSYNWDTLIGGGDVTETIAKSIFLLSIVNGGLHATSFMISVSLAVIFRHINQLPPDLNPLEDNLTARPHKRNKSEFTEKHLSHSSLGSDLDAPLIGPPRNVPFMHTRGMSGDDSGHFSWGIQDTPPQVPAHHDYSPRAQPARQEVRFRQLASQPNISIPQIPVQSLDSALARPSSAIIQNDPAWEPAVPETTRCESPASDNWVQYPSRTPSPVYNDAPAHDTFLHEDNTQTNNLTSRGPSSMFSRSNTSASTNSTFRNWLNYSQRVGRDMGEPIAEEARGGYESLATNEYYGMDDDMRQHSKSYDTTNEQDLGDRYISIHLDETPEDDGNKNSPSHPLPVNPLAMNPPTPQPTPDNARTPSNATRVALTDIPNLTPNPPAKSNSQTKGARFYNTLETKPENDAQIPKRQRSKLAKQPKKSAYNSLKQHDDQPTVADRAADRKGRVVSNSGADIAAQRSLGLGSTLSYGNYIAGLGVGRRRDVSGKIAEEGRGGGGGDIPVTGAAAAAAAATKKSESENTTPARAAGWARFAGL